MTHLTFWIPGVPVPMARPRVTKRGTFTPKETLQFRERVQWNVRAQRTSGVLLPLLGPLRVSVSFYFPIPGSWSKKRKGAAAVGAIPMDKKPDLDNLVKAIFDAGNLLLWRDDAQIVLLRAMKYYATEPGVSLTVIPHGSPGETACPSTPA